MPLHRDASDRSCAGCLAAVSTDSAAFSRKQSERDDSPLKDNGKVARSETSGSAGGIRIRCDAAPVAQSVRIAEGGKVNLEDDDPHAAARSVGQRICQIGHHLIVEEMEIHAKNTPDG